MSKYTLTIEGDFEKGDCYSCPLAFNAEDTYGDSVSLCSQMVSYEDCPLEEVKQEWIPTSERLPKSTIVVLMTTKDLIRPAIGYYLESENCWKSISGGEWDMEEVTAWMPLPETYKEGGK